MKNKKYLKILIPTINYGIFNRIVSAALMAPFLRYWRRDTAKPPPPMIYAVEDKQTMTVLKNRNNHMEKKILEILATKLYNNCAWVTGKK